MLTSHVIIRYTIAIHYCISVYYNTCGKIEVVGFHEMWFTLHLFVIL